jgi:PAS domain S-box-containing protein|tara:strand:+ start:3037 stop:5391 length:2355 start_codon:yes stop_codon:yes gene_type:complete
MVTRKLAEYNVSQSEKQYRSLIEEMQDPVLIYINEHLRFGNQAAAKAFGYESTDNLIDADMLSHVHPEDHVIIERRQAAIAQGKTLPSEDIRYLKRNGGTFHANAYGFNTTFESKPARIAVLRDVTDRKKAEEKLQQLSDNLENLVEDRTRELQESESKYRDLVETSHDLIWRLDEQGRFTYVNPAWESTFGYTPKEMIGRLVTDFKSPLEIARTKEDYKKILVGERVTDFETTYLTKQGQELTLNLNTTPIHGREGNFVGVQGNAQNVTARILADAELNLFHEVIKNMAGGVTLVRAEDSTIFFTNPTYDEMFGYEPGQMLGKNSMDLVASGGDKTAEQSAEEIVKGLSEQGWWRGEVYNLKKDGTRFWTTAYVSEMEQPKFGKVWLTVQHDITEQKQIMEQLRQSQKMEALGTLAGGIAHDFNNVLTPIIGYTEMLMDSPDQGEDRELLEPIINNALRAKELVSQILLFSRPGQTTKQLSDLRPLVQELVKFTHSTIPSSVTVSDVVSVESAVVLCDVSQIHQVLVNLCINAGHAITGIGEIRIRLDVVELEDFSDSVGNTHSGNHVRISVIDDGEGIDEETLTHIFEPFYSTKGVGEGSGLGLSTVFGIVQDHGGGIAVSSEPGKGTTFEIFLPLAKTPIKQLPATPEKLQKGGSEHILFVDDEDTITSLGRRALERLGYQVTVASDGQAALDVFSENPKIFDMLVTDQTMPRLTGNLLTHEVMKISPNLPVMLCSGHNTIVTPENSRSMGIRRFMYKPYGPKALGQSVREVLDEAEEAKR